MLVALPKRLLKARIHASAQRERSRTHHYPTNIAGLGAIAYNKKYNPCPKTLVMPVISMFYGVIVRMYYFDNQKHQCPHIHVSYQDDEAVLAIPNGDILEGKLQKSKLKLVQAWIEIHQDELMANWQLAVNGQQVFKINPLQ